MEYKKLDRLATRYGTPFYIFYPERFASNLEQMHGTFNRYYENTLLAYAFKANYMPWLGSCLARYNYWGEVVSGMEYDIARVNLPGDRLVFNGPCKTRKYLQLALSEGALVNLESPHDLKIIEELEPLFPEIKVGLRVTFDIGTGASRFGFNYDNGDFSGALIRLQKHTKVTIIGIHSHFTTQTRSLDIFNKRATRMLKIYESMPLNRKVRYINIGGGFYGPMSEEFKKVLDIDPPSFEDYAQTIGGAFSKYFGGTGPALIVEPGVSMVADSMEFVVRVLDCRVSEGRRYLTVDGSINNLFASGSKYKPIYKAVSSRKRTEMPCNVVGYTCMEHDILLQDKKISAVAGDFIVFSNRGAYSNVFKPPFICAAPPILGLDGKVFCHRQTTEDVISPYVLEDGRIQ